MPLTDIPYFRRILMKVFLFGMVLLLPCFSAFAQKHTISFTVVDETRKPLSYASVVFISRESGGMTNEQGFVSLIANSKTDTIKISAVSYSPTIKPLWDLHQNDTIVLKKNAAILDSIIVTGTNKETKRTTIGYYREKNNASFILRPGAQIALSIQNNNRIKGRLKKVHFRLEKLTNCNTPLRIRILESTDRSLPGADILQTNIILNSNNQKKFNTVDLSEYSVPFTGNGVFIVLEWLDANQNCINPKTPVITANLSLESNLVWFNFRDRKWEKRRNVPVRNSKFMTPNISIEVGY